MQYDETVIKTVSQEGTAGDEQMYFGSNTGYIYRMDSGISFDGDLIDSSFRLANNEI